MSSRHTARVRWLTAEAGGRRIPPPGPTYSTVARFESMADMWPHEAWSVVLDFEHPADTSGDMVADIRMLAGDLAPKGLLVAGARFELLEGARLVARGEISDVSRAVDHRRL